MFEKDFIVNLNKFIIKLFYTLKKDFDALKKDFDCSNNIFTLFSTKKVLSLSWNKSSNDIINKMKIENWKY